jgi:hypothetical protein
MKTRFLSENAVEIEFPGMTNTFIRSFYGCSRFLIYDRFKISVRDYHVILRPGGEA